MCTATAVHLPSGHIEALLSPQPLLLLFSSVALLIVILLGVRRHLLVVLMCRSLLRGDLWHFAGALWRNIEVGLLPVFELGWAFC